MDAALHTAAIPRDYLTSGDENPYGYVPTHWIAILFLVLFGLSTAAHSGQAICYKLKIFVFAVICGIMEIIGWVGRVWSSRNPLNGTPFNMQLEMTIIGPTFLTVVYFKYFESLVNILGPSYSRIRPHLYHSFFLGCDILSLLLQVLGGSIATSGDSQEESSVGDWIMFVGIVIQFVSLTVYLILATEFFLRYYNDRPIKQQGDSEKSPESPSTGRGTLTPRLFALSGALIFGSLCLFIRCVYRAIEIGARFESRFSHTQVYFNVLEGTMIVLAMVTLNILHPGVLLLSLPHVVQISSPASANSDPEKPDRPS
ncbi:hypothetical protein D9619_002221 [Psilocybe cf. subviscida]|uniref:Uncharacterized protein n=1 Tax=Psilocybe cf. subviscida TaxID=2480587 RepID=A0A8H5BFC1_9AGAR|nr:hypothetical protein D9619_002221 [Psilocybe cf. subviscida]